MYFFVRLLGLLLLPSALLAQALAREPLTATLRAGYPPQAAFFVEQYHATHLAYTALATGVDSLQVLIGTFHQGEASGYYALTLYRGKYGFRTFALPAALPASRSVTPIELPLPQVPLRVVVQLQQETGMDKLRYTWLSPTGPSKQASLQPTRRLQPHMPLPPLTVQALDGRNVSLSDFKGKYVVLNWWATSCGPCLAELPVLNKLVSTYQARSDVAFVAVAAEEVEKVKTFLAKRPFAYQQTASKAAATLFGGAYPVHLLVNPEGIILYYGEGVETQVVRGEVVVQRLGIEQALEQQLPH